MANADNWPLPANTNTEDGLAGFEIGDGVRVFDVRGLLSDAFMQDSPIEKIGFAVHHAVTGVGDGTVRGDLEVIRAIHRYHTTPAPNGNGWPGIGYHRVIGNGKRIYIVGGSASQRAHVKDLNHHWIGWCFLGNWTIQRPPEAMMTAFKVGVQWETDQRGVPMLLRPHKFLNPGTDCPGGWAAVDAWEGVVLQPGAAEPPAPTPDPAPDLIAQARSQGRREMIAAVDAALDPLRSWT